MTYRLVTPPRITLAAAAIVLLLAAAAFAQTAPAAPATEMYDGSQVISHRVLFAFKTPPTPARLNAVETLLLGAAIRPVGGAGAYLAQSQQLDVAQLIATLRQQLDVAYAEPDALMHAESVTPDDPQFPSQWAMNNTGQEADGVSGTPGADISAPAAWQIATGNRSIAVALIDTGVQYDHPDLAANIWSAPSAFTINVGGFTMSCPAGNHGLGWIAADFGCDPADYENQPVLAHGTGNAGIIGAVGNNGTGVAGVNWNVSIIPLKACEPVAEGSGEYQVECPESDVTDALESAIQLKVLFGAAADVVAANMSFNGGQFGDTLENEMERAEGFGITIAVSTGDDCGSGAQAPASFYLDNEIAVAASNQQDGVAYWPSANACSSGGGNIAAPGSDILTADDTSGYYYAEGTSASAPFVTGAIALVASVCPLPPHNMVEDIVNSADNVPALDSISGGKRLNLANALTDCTTGTPGTGQVTIQGAECESCRFIPPRVPDYGNLVLEIGVDQYVYPYRANGSTTSATVAAIFASRINDNPFSPVTAQLASGSSTINLTSKAKGPWTNFHVSFAVQDECSPPPHSGDICWLRPFTGSASFTGGSQ